MESECEYSSPSVNLLEIYVCVFISHTSPMQLRFAVKCTKSVASKSLYEPTV